MSNVGKAVCLFKMDIYLLIDYTYSMLCTSYGKGIANCENNNF